MLHISLHFPPLKAVQELGGVSGPCRAIADPRREGVGSLPAAAHEALDAGAWRPYWPAVPVLHEACTRFEESNM